MAQYPESKHTDSEKFEQIFVKVVELVEQGGSIDREVLQQKHPEFAEAILEYLENRQRFEDLIRRDQIWRDKKKVTFDKPEMIAQHGGDDPVALGESAPLSSTGRIRNREFPIEFGSYTLINEIDRGGMGIVFKAKHNKLNRIVALKIMRSAALASDDDVKRFRGEANATAAINHPNIVPIYEVGEVQGLLYFTMAYVSGDSLDVYVHEKRLSVREATRIVVKVAGAIAAAHRCGIVHRDLKPSNVLLDESREPLVIDFGLAKTRNAVEALTVTGQIMGTPAYMAPEQAQGRGETLSPAPDIYSLGALLYSLVTGQPPFSGLSPFDILLQVIDRDPPSPRSLNGSIPRDLAIVIQRAMEKEVKQRYRSVEELLADLNRFLLGEPIPSKQTTLGHKMHDWWRREPDLVTHLYGVAAVLLTVIGSSLILRYESTNLLFKLALLCFWGIGSFIFKRLAANGRIQEAVYYGWATFDVAIFTLLVYFADPSRGLLLIGYPAMIAATGLFYRTRFVMLMTSLCLVGFLTLWFSVDDPSLNRIDFCLIFIAGLIALGMTLAAMIRRVRGLHECFSERQRFQKSISKPKK